MPKIRSRSGVRWRGAWAKKTSAGRTGVTAAVPRMRKVEAIQYSEKSAGAGEAPSMAKVTRARPSARPTSIASVARVWISPYIRQ